MKRISVPVFRLGAVTHLGQRDATGLPELPLVDGLDEGVEREGLHDEGVAVAQDHAEYQILFLKHNLTYSECQTLYEKYQFV